MRQPQHPATANVTPPATGLPPRFATGSGGTRAIAALALLGALAAAPAQAAESTLTPYFNTLLFGGIDRDSNGSYPLADIYITDHRSNTAPLSQSNGGAISAEGALFQGVGQSTYSGFFASRNYASMRVTNAQAPHTYYTVSGQGASTGVRFFTAEAAAANAVFTWRVTGSASNTSTGGRAESRLDFGTTVGSVGDYNDLFVNPSALNAITRFGPGTYTYNLPVADLGEAIYLYFWSAAFTAANSGEFVPGSSFEMTANFASTYVLEDVDLYDTQGKLLSDWTLAALDTQETLFNQNGRVAPIDAAPRLPDLPTLGVPAPGSLALALAGLVLLGRRRRAGYFSTNARSIT